MIVGGVAVAVLAGCVVIAVSGGGGSSRTTTRASSGSTAARTVAPAGVRKKVAATKKKKVAFSMPGAHLAPRQAVPILMYHVIGVPTAGTPNLALWVSPTDFAAHVAALRGAGYHAVTLQRVWDAWHHAGKLPSHPIVLSFDDGYRGQVRDALPTLSAAGWPGVLNLELANLKDTGGTKAIKRLIRAGWEIDAHTLTHPDLTTVDDARLADEIAGSRARLRRYFAVPVNFFCYPSGRYDSRVIAGVRAAGYQAATTTQAGWARPGDDPYALPRVRINGAMTPAAVLQRVKATAAS